MKRFIVLLMLLGFVVEFVDAAAPRTMVYAVEQGDTLRMDFYATKHSNAPCVVFMFGGAFSHGVRNKASYIPFFKFLQYNGFAVATIDYRLGLAPLLTATSRPSFGEFITMMTHSVDIAVEDLFSATAYLVDNAEGLGIDTARIVSCGSSAGAVSVLTAEWDVAGGRTRGRLPQNFNYAGVIAFAGAVYSTEGKPSFDGAWCPVQMFHGSVDSNVPYRKLSIGRRGLYGSEYIAEKLAKSDVPYYFCSFEQDTHRIAVTPMDDNRSEILMFLQRYVVGGARLQTSETVTNLALPRHRGSIGITDYIHSNFGSAGN